MYMHVSHVSVRGVPVHYASYTLEQTLYVLSTLFYGFTTGVCRNGFSL